MKTAEQIRPNFGPVYTAAMYPGLCAIFQKHGYALAVHGSLARDLDLVAIPWAERVSDREDVLKEVTSSYALTVIDTPKRFTVKPHGRVAYTLACGFGECAIDLSFFDARRDGIIEGLRMAAKINADLFLKLNTPRPSSLVEGQMAAHDLAEQAILAAADKLEKEAE